MDRSEIREILSKVAAGELTPEEAELKLRVLPFEDLGFAKIDHHRAIRQGAAEVIYGAGKTDEQIIKIAGTMLERGEKTVLITRIGKDTADKLTAALGGRFVYSEAGRAGIAGEMPEPKRDTHIVVATGGTSDIPVAEEAAFTAEAMGSRVIRLFDVGVSGIHRLLSHAEEIMSAKAVVAVAGMEGALPSVIGGLADCPVIAVPTSVGYGAAFGGVAALLSMLNSCASGVSVVNIDNGFGAGYLANMIER